MPRSTLLSSRKWLRTIDRLERSGAAELGIAPADAQPLLWGWLGLLWDTAHNSGANPVLGSARDVEIACRWKREPGALHRVLAEERWIDEVDPGDETQPRPGSGCWAIHDYEDHRPRFLATRDSGRERQARYRQRQRERAEAAEGGSNVPPEPPPAAGSGDDAPAPAAKPKKARSKERPDDHPLPPSLDTPTFREAWARWHAYRREARHPAWQPSTCKNWLGTFAEWGEARAVAALEWSIKQVYQGVVEPRPPAGAPPPPPPPPPPEPPSAAAKLERAVAEARDVVFAKERAGKIDEERRDQLLEYLDTLNDTALVARAVRELNRETQ